MAYHALNTTDSTGYRPGVGMGYYAGGGGPNGENQGWNPTMGYESSTDRGWRGGLHGLGAAVSTDNMTQLMVDGCDPNDVALAASLGMTDAQAAQILSLDDSDAEENALLQLIGTLQPPNVVAPVQSQPPVTAPSNVQSPPGSTLIYSATYNVNTGVPGGSLLVTPSQVIQSLTARLGGTGLSIVGVNTSSYGNNSFTVQVLDSIGHQNFSDAQSVLDAMLNQIAGVTKISSSISPGAIAGAAPVTPAAGPGGVIAPAATSVASWLETNAAYIGIGLAAVILGSALIKKKW